MLWQKEFNSSQSLYVDLFENKKHSTDNFVFTSKKSSVVAVQARLEGNQQYSQKDFNGAMFMYNRSIRFAENDSENLALAYGNRSSCFYGLQNFDKCLVDIKLTKSCNCPERLLTKLNEREQKCLSKLESISNTSSSRPVLSFNADEKLSCMANVLQIETTVEYGRIIKAKRDIQIGDTLLIEDAYVHKFYGPKLNKCTNCGIKEGNFIPCKNCSGVMYCSENCAQNLFHDVECDMIFGANDYVNGESLGFVIRSVIIGVNTFETIEEMIQFVENCQSSAPIDFSDSVASPKEKYLTFFKLASFLPDKVYDFHKSGFIIFNAVMASKLGFKFGTLEEQRFLIHLIVHHGLILHLNAFGGFSKSITEWDESTADMYSENEHRKFLHLISSYFNHSCVPNVVKITKNNSAVVKAVLPIKKGQQLFINYVADGLFNTREELSVHLQNNYGFTCKCEICTKGVLRAPNIQDSSFIYVRDNISKTIDNFDLNLISKIKEQCVKFLLNYSNMVHTLEGNYIAHNLGAMFEKELNER